MNIYEMRDYITRAYPGEKWKQRCKEMKPRQVMAVYFSILSSYRNKKKQTEGYSRCNTNTLQALKGEEGIQMTIFDFLGGES